MSASTLGQLRALLRVYVLMLSRVTIPGRPAVESRNRRMMLMGIRGLSFVLPTVLGWGASHGPPLNDTQLKVAIAWSLLGMALSGFGFGFVSVVPLPRQPQPMRPQLLESLPISLGAQLMAACAPTLAIAGFWVALVVSSTAHMGAVLVVLPLWPASWLWGCAVARTLRVLMPLHVMARLGVIGLLAGIVGLELAALRVTRAAPALLNVRPPSVLRPSLWCSAALTAWSAESVFLATAAIVLAGALAFGVVAATERISFDRSGPGTSARKIRGSTAVASMLAAHVRMTRREPGRWIFAMYWVIASLLVGTLVFVVVKARRRVSAEEVDMFASILAPIVAQFAFIFAGIRAVRSVTRDASARPLLGSLPMTPTDTLAGKARSLRRQLVLLALPLLVILPLARHPLETTLVWRLPLLLIALALYADAVVASAFLTVGLGGRGPSSAQSGLPKISLELFLIASPFLVTAVTPHPAQALLSLACLGAVTFEARRAALRTMSWIDDPEHDGSTGTWRALLALASFQAIQTIVALICGVFASTEVTFAVSYFASAVALVLLTLQGRPAPERILPRVPYLAAGLLGGALTGALAVGYLALRKKLDWAPEAAPMTLTVAAIAVGVAPIAEELFFRGWLQRAVRDELPARRAWWAPVLVAAAFAAVHPAVSFVPVLALGLVTGLLYVRSGTVHAGIVAHATHNAIAVGVALFLLQR